MPAPEGPYFGARGRFQLWAPGLISGAADTDPTTVATMAVVGASTVYGLAWLVVLMFPALAIIQIISARVGVVTRKDLQSCVDKRFGWVARLVLLASVFAVTVVVRNAPRFYATLALSMGLGVLITYSGVSPIRILFISGIIGGVATPIGLAFLLLVASDAGLMQRWRIKGVLLIGGWLVTGLVSLASLIYLIQQLTS